MVCGGQVSVASYLQIGTFPSNPVENVLWRVWNQSCVSMVAMRDTANFSSPISLSEAGEQAVLKILLIMGGWGVRRSLNRMGIQPGDHVRVLRRAPFGGPVLIDNRGNRVAVGRGMAEKIRVEVLP